MIRNASIEDLDTLVAYNVKMAYETEKLVLNQDKLKQGVLSILTDQNKGRYFVYEKDNQVVGQLMVTLEWSDWRNGYFWWIQSVYVNREYRRQGIFQALYQHVKKLVEKDDSICGLRLYVEKENHTAQSTYQTLGMTETHYLLYEWEK